MTNNQIKPIQTIGYHIDCGLPIYPNDHVRIESELVNRQKESINIYRCIVCKCEIKETDLIPF